jgi:hypothetical protein
MGEKMSGEFCRQIATSTLFEGILTSRKAATWDRQIYFPSEGRHSEEFFALKNPTASAGFEPANPQTTEAADTGITKVS